MSFLTGNVVYVGKIEDEYHAVIECPRYQNFWNMYILNYLLIRPSMFKFIQNLNTDDPEELRRCGKFCHRLFKYYETYVFWGIQLH